MELTLTLPIFGLILLGLFEFSVLFFARGEVVEACRTAARKATCPGVSQADVEFEVQRVLSPRLRNAATVETDLGERSGDVVLVRIRVPMRQAAPNLLWPIGFDLTRRDLVAETRMVRE